MNPSGDRQLKTLMEHFPDIEQIHTAHATFASRLRPEIERRTLMLRLTPCGAFSLAHLVGSLAPIRFR